MPLMDLEGELQLSIAQVRLVRINHPGPNENRTDGIVKHFSSITPLGRPGHPDDIEGPGAYLASDASRFHTGDILVVDGGRTVKSM